VQRLGQPAVWRSFGELEHSARTAAPAADTVVCGRLFKYLAELFKYLADHPDEVRLLDAAMAAQAYGRATGSWQPIISRDSVRSRTSAADRAICCAGVVAPIATDARCELPHVVDAARGVARSGWGFRIAERVGPD
jgi:hypothetical protein